MPARVAEALECSRRPGRHRRPGRRPAAVAALAAVHDRRRATPAGIAGTVRALLDRPAGGAELRGLGERVGRG